MLRSKNANEYNENKDEIFEKRGNYLSGEDNPIYYFLKLFKIKAETLMQNLLFYFKQNKLNHSGTQNV